MRRSNLAHLLAISGLHMGLLTGIVFATIRTAFLCSPQLALRLPIKKIAAVFAIATGATYLVLSGASVATERAFIMVSVMFGAILLDRPAISLRSVAVAATLILVCWPEFLMEPGFQMSFSATIALVVCFRALKPIGFLRPSRVGIRKYSSPVISLALSSVIAGLATAPFAAFHFNQVAHYGLPANMASLPVMGLVVMPAALLGLVTAPFGLSDVGFWIMGKGIGWILAVAEIISNWPHAVSKIADAGSFVLPLISLGAVIIVLLSGRAKFAGAAFITAGFILWNSVERPDVLISDTGRLVGVMENGKRALNRTRGSGFAANSWLENDGSALSQKQSKWFPDKDADGFVVEVKGVSLGYLWNKKAKLSDVENICGHSDLLIAPVWKGETPRGCDFLAQQDLHDMGAFSIDIRDGKAEIETARQRTGARLWNTRKTKKN